MDDLKITPEELAQILGESDDSAPAAPLPVAAPAQAPAQQVIGRQAAAPAAPAQVVSPPPAMPAQVVNPPPAVPVAAPPVETHMPPVTARPAQFSQLSRPGNAPSGTNLDLLLGVTLRVAVELGRTRMTIEDILKLGPGSVVELDKLAGEPVDVLVNDRLIARGEVVVIDDRFGVRITDVIPPAQRVTSL